MICGEVFPDFIVFINAVCLSRDKKPMSEGGQGWPVRVEAEGSEDANRQMAMASVT